nr:hypothetical protein [Allomuricauda sp.]
MNEKLSLSYRLRAKSKSIKWDYHRTMASRATLIGLICFFIVLSIQNGFLFLDKILICTAIIGALLAGSYIKKQ